MSQIAELLTGNLSKVTRDVLGILKIYSMVMEFCFVAKLRMSLGLTQRTVSLHLKTAETLNVKYVTKTTDPSTDQRSFFIGHASHLEQDRR